MRDARWVVGLFALAMLMSATATAQNSPSTDRGGGAAVWHDAQRYRDLLSEGPLVAEQLAQAMEAELALGRPGGALGLLDALGGDTLAAHPRIVPLIAAAHVGLGRPEIAAQLFSGAARAATDPVTRAVYLARAADAFGEANQVVAAHAGYQDARAELYLLAGWIAIREARVAPDTGDAFALLAGAPTGSERFAAAVRAKRLLAAGDTAAAVPALIGAGRPGEAAELALRGGDTTRARAIAYDALSERDTAVVRNALQIVARAIPPTDPSAQLRVGRAYQRLGGTQVAVRWVRAAVAGGDSSAATLRLLGDVESEVRQTVTALNAYAQAAALGGADGALAAYRRARLLIRAGRRAEGYSALLEFADQHSDHSAAPLAVYLVADGRRAAGRGSLADSLFRDVSRRWPTADYAARARFHLATRALRSGDTTTALGWYEDEVAARGRRQLAARYEIARVRLAGGDTAGAMRAWNVLAQRDPIGYYGTVARLAADMPVPTYDPTVPPAGGLAVQRTLATIDLLHRLDWMAETEAVVTEAVDRRTWSAEDALALGDGLIKRGWMAQGITLGWRAASTLGTTDPRVLRVIFPWPLRELIVSEARKYGLDPYLVAGLIRQESMFRRGVISRAGATGLMQLMPTTAVWLARRLGVDWNQQFLAVADANLHLGAAHLSGLLDRYDGSVVFALAAYNAGGRPVDRWRRFPEAADPFQFVERIPYLETRGYVRSVLRNRELYRALYPDIPQPADAAQQ